MNKNIRGRKLAVIIAVGFLFIIMMNRLYIRNEVKQYTIGDKLVNNPDRGFYIQVSSEKKEKLKKYAENVRVVLLAFDLYEYRNETIPDNKLCELEEFLKEAEEQNIKCVFRAAYGFDREESNDADSLERIREHISQISPILNEYKNQIVCVQAGFFGPWGEWHSSKFLEKEENAKQNRCWLLKELLGQLEQEIVIDVRRPQFIREAVDAGLPLERIGFHNDGLLGSESDLGTYDEEGFSREDEMNWLEENLLTGLNGGEMPGVNEYSQVKRALNEFPKIKLSYLNLRYNEEVYELWKEQTVNGENAFDYIEQHLGYRFYISEVKYPMKLKKGILGWNRKIEITVVNEGFAPISKNYGMEWVVEDYNDKKYFFDEDDSLSGLENEMSAVIELPISDIKDIHVKRIGVRVSNKNDNEKKDANCVEFVNDEFYYEDGINYFLQVDDDTKISGF